MDNVTYLRRPSREEIAAMPVFEALPLSRIQMVKSPADVAVASRALAEARFIGFDTESKPTFTVGAVSTGPHVIQFATLEQAFIVQVDSTEPVDFLSSVIESTQLVKVGFGLSADRGALRRKLGLQASTNAANLRRANSRLLHRSDVLDRIPLAEPAFFSVANAAYAELAINWALNLMPYCAVKVWRATPLSPRWTTS